MSRLSAATATPAPTRVRARFFLPLMGVASLAIAAAGAATLITAAPRGSAQIRPAAGVIKPYRGGWVASRQAGSGSITASPSRSKK